MRAVTFHNVVAEPLDLFDRELWRMAASRFRRAVDMLRRRYEIVSLPDALGRLDQGDAAPDALVITFDDGFANVFDVARPILAEAGAVASIFVLTDAGAPIPPSRLLHFEQLEIAFRLTQASTLDVRELGLPPFALSSEREKLTALLRIKRGLKPLAEPKQTQLQEQMLLDLGVGEDEIAAFAARFSKYRKLSAQQMRHLAAEGWTVGGHTRTHRPLSSLGLDQLRDEIGGNFDDLKSAFGWPAVPFAYPYGSPQLIAGKARDLVEACGFRCAFTTIVGDNGPGTDRFQLRRFSDMAIIADLTVGGIPLVVSS